MPDKTFRLLTIIYVLLTSITMLFILVQAFDASKEKYLPAMIEANMYALPLIISALALFFAVFFEPGSLKKKTALRFFRLLFIFLIFIFTFFIITQSRTFSTALWSLSVAELLLLLAVAYGLITKREEA